MFGIAIKIAVIVCIGSVQAGGDKPKLPQARAQQGVVTLRVYPLSQIAKLESISLNSIAKKMINLLKDYHCELKKGYGGFGELDVKISADCSRMWIKDELPKENVSEVWQRDLFSVATVIQIMCLKHHIPINEKVMKEYVDQVKGIDGSKAGYEALAEIMGNVELRDNA